MTSGLMKSRLQNDIISRLWAAFARVNRRRKDFRVAVLNRAKASRHESSPREKATNGSRAREADSRANDIPFPVNGGIMESASPRRNSSIGGGSPLPMGSPETAVKEGSSHLARISRSRNDLAEVKCSTKL